MPKVANHKGFLVQQVIVDVLTHQLIRKFVSHIATHQTACHQSVGYGADAQTCLGDGIYNV